MNILLMMLIVSSSSFAFRSELTAKDWEKLNRGETIERVEELKDEVFPQVTLVSVIPYSPHENMKVFTNFNDHKNFIPGMLQSKIVKVKGNVTDVYFEMYMPMVKNTEYTTRHTVIFEGKNAFLDWDLVKSDQVKRTKGKIVFEDHEGKTLFTYVSLITPKSKLAWVVKNQVLPDVKKTIEAVKSHLAKTIEAQRKNSPD